MVTLLPATGTPETLAKIGYDGTTWDQPWHLARGQLTTLERMPSAELEPGGPVVAPGCERLSAGPEPHAVNRAPV